MKLRYKILYMSLGLVGVHPKQELSGDEIQKLVISNLEDRHEENNQDSKYGIFLHYFLERVGCHW